MRRGICYEGNPLALSGKNPGRSTWESLFQESALIVAVNVLAVVIIDRILLSPRRCYQHANEELNETVTGI